MIILFAFLGQILCFETFRTGSNEIPSGLRTCENRRQRRTSDNFAGFFGFDEEEAEYEYDEYSGEDFEPVRQARMFGGVDADKKRWKWIVHLQFSTGEQC